MGHKFNTQSFIEISNQKHKNRFDYSLAEYKNSRTKIKIICPVHGEFEQDPSDHIKGHGCRKCHTDTFKTWSEKSDKFLIENYHKLKAKECSEILCKTENAIRARAKFLNITKKQRIINNNIPVYLWNNLIGRANELGYKLDFDSDFVWTLFNKQQRKCALTGWHLVFSKDVNKNTASIDRIDSSKGYTKKNIQITHKIVNRCKLNCSEELFYFICKSVYLNRNDLEKYKLDFEWDIYNDTVSPMKKTNISPNDYKKHILTRVKNNGKS